MSVSDPATTPERSNKMNTAEIRERLNNAIGVAWEYGGSAAEQEAIVDAPAAINAAKADAWDEGFDASEIWSSSKPGEQMPPNPYRADGEEQQ